MDLSETARDGIDSRRGGAPGAPAMAYMPSRKLQGRIALINCGDGTFARTVALCFALEGARVALCNHGGTGFAREIRREIRSHGGTCLVLQEQCRGSDACLRLVEHVVAQLGALDILVNSGNTTVEPGDDQLSRIEATFRSSTFPYLYLMTAALPYLPAGGCVINSSLLASGGGDCIDPDTDAAESAIVALTRSFARAAAARGIRVNAISRSTMG
ncbi:MAG: SDR family oxidoreductase, partial [Sphingomonadales bacterium]